MPYSITTKDGITINNIPDNVDPNSQELKDRVAQLRGQPQVSQEQPKERGFVDELTRQVGLAARSGLEGTMGTIGIFSDPFTQLMNKYLPPEHQAAMAKEAISNVLTKAGVPEPENKTEKIMQQALQSTVGAGGMIGAGKFLASSASPIFSALGQSLSAEPAAQIAGSAASGGASEKIKQEGGGVGWQMLGGLGAGVAGAGLSGLAIPSAAAQIPQAVKEAEKQGINVMTSDIVPPGSFASKWLQAAGERVPVVGTGPIRAAQQEQRIDAVRNLLREYGATSSSELSDDIMKDLSSKRSADLTKYSNLKSDVINNLGNAGAVPVENTVKAIDTQINNLTALKTKEVEPVISRLQDWKNAIQDQNLPNLELLRKQIGESFKAPELTAVRGTGEKALSSIYGAMKQDMGDFIKTNGESRDFTKWEVSNKRLSDMAGEMDMSAFKSVLKKGEATPEVVNNMLFSKKPSEVAQLYKSLTPEGRATAQAAILSKAAENVIGKGQSIDSISPDRFSNEVKKLGTSVGIFFKGDDLKKVEGLQRALQLTKRGMEAGAAPPTGVQNWYALMGLGGAGVASALGGGTAGFLGTVGAAGALGGAARIYESKPVRDLLIKLSQAPAGSDMESALARRLNEVIRDQQLKEKNK